jgi:hypothetical protein
MSANYLLNRFIAQQESPFIPLERIFWWHSGRAFLVSSPFSKTQINVML